LAKVNATVDSLKLAQAEYIQNNNGTASTTLGSLGITNATTTTEVSGLVLTDTGAIEATLANIGSPFDNSKIVFTAVPRETALTWDITCTNMTATAKSTAIMTKVFGTVGAGC